MTDRTFLSKFNLPAPLTRSMVKSRLTVALPPLLPPRRPPDGWQLTYIVKCKKAVVMLDCLRKGRKRTEVKQRPANFIRLGFSDVNGSTQGLKDRRKRSPRKSAKELPRSKEPPSIEGGGHRPRPSASASVPSSYTVEQKHGGLLN